MVSCGGDDHVVGRDGLVERRAGLPLAPVEEGDGIQDIALVLYAGPPHRRLSERDTVPLCDRRLGNLVKAVASRSLPLPESRPEPGWSDREAQLTAPLQ